MKIFVWSEHYPDWGIRMLHMSWGLLHAAFWDYVNNLKLVEKE